MDIKNESALLTLETLKKMRVNQKRERVAE